MAKDTNRIIDETVGAFKRLKEEIKGYKDELATLTVGSEKWTQTAQKLANAQKQVDAINKAAKGTLIDYSKAQANSIAALKEKIKLLTQEQEQMDMNSKEYKEATKQLKVLNDQLRDEKVAAGDMRANVGNYAAAIKDAFGQLGGAATGLSGNMGVLNASMLKLASNPIGATVLALVSAIKFLAEGIKSSEENTNRWNQAMTPLRTVMVMIQKAAQDMASKFLDFVESLKQSETTGKVIQGVLTVLITLFNQTVTRIRNLKEGIVGIFDDVKTAVGKFKEWGEGLQKTFEPVTKFVGNIYDGIKEKLSPVIDWIVKQYNRLAETNLGKVFGLQTIEQIKKGFDGAKESTKEFVEEYKETEKEVDKLAKTEANYQRQKRGLLVANAKLQGEIATLEEKIANARLNKDYTTALDLLNQKREKEQQLVKNNIALAGVELSIIKQRNALADSNSKDLEAEAQAEAALINAKNEEARVNSRLANQERELKQQRDSEEKKKQAEALKKSIAELTQELNRYQQTYQSAISVEAPERPDIFTYGNTDSYYDQIKENAQIEYDAYATMVDNKIIKLQEWLDEQRAAGVEEKDLSSQIIELEKLKGEAAAGYPQQYKKMIDTQNKADKDRAKTLKVLQKSELQGYANLFDGISGLFEQDSIAYKATAVAKAIVSTYLAASESFANAGGAPWGFIPMAASIAAGLAQVKQILSVNAKGETNVPSTQASTPAVAEPVMVDSQPFTYTRTAQTFEEEDQLNQPMFVSVTDINNVQNRVKVVEEESSF